EAAEIRGIRTSGGRCWKRVGGVIHIARLVGAGSYLCVVCQGGCRGVVEGQCNSRNICAASDIGHDVSLLSTGCDKDDVDVVREGMGKAVQRYRDAAVSSNAGDSDV